MFSRAILYLGIGLNAIVSSVLSSSPNGCSLYIAPSKIPGAGRGIFAGKDFVVDEVLETDPSITVLYEHTSATSLAHYVYGFNEEEYSMVNFGIGCLLNFVPSKVSVRNVWADDHMLSGAPSNLPYTNTSHVYFEATQDISIGHEMYVSYGDSWFEEREDFQNVDIDPVELDLAYEPDELAEKGVCVSDIIVATSTISIANLGLHAFRSYQKGELITVSPVLVLPMDVVENTKASSTLMNYVWTEANAKVGLFPLGHAAMINHASAKPDTLVEHIVNDSEENEDSAVYSNAAIRWFDWQGYVENKADTLAAGWNQTLYPSSLSSSYEKIIDTPYAPLDIALFATRDIQLGEELFVDYGASWEQAFQSWLYSDAIDENSQKFRHPLYLPSGMLPKQWFNIAGGPTSINNESTQNDESLHQVTEAQQEILTSSVQSEL